MKSSFNRFQDWLGDWDEGKTRQTLVVVLAVLCGLLLGMVLDTVLHRVGDFMFPPPPVLDFADKDQLRELLKTMPVEGYLIRAISWALGTLGGGYCAVRMAKAGQFPAWIVGILLYAGYLIGMISLPNPLWVWLLCPVLVGVCAWGAGWIGMYVTVQKQMKAQTQLEA